MWADRVVVARE